MNNKKETLLLILKALWLIPYVVITLFFIAIGLVCLAIKAFFQIPIPRMEEF